MSLTVQWVALREPKLLHPTAQLVQVVEHPAQIGTEAA
jgi:hypothetical protein